MMSGLLSLKERMTKGINNLKRSFKKWGTKGQRWGVYSYRRKEEEVNDEDTQFEEREMF